MRVLKLDKNNFSVVLAEAAKALNAGKTVVYPTDTSYGLGAVATNPKAIAKIYKIKERGFNKPVHVLVPSVYAAKKLVKWNSLAQKMAKKFWPGPLSMALPLKMSALKKICAGTDYLGLRMPKNKFALMLVKKVGQPLTATSANPSAHLSGGFDSYSAKDVISQFQNKKYRPDLIIDAGQLPKVKPSTFVRLVEDKNMMTGFAKTARIKYKVEILRPGPISEKQLNSI